MNEITRQQKLDAFVAREVILCQSTLVEELLQKEIFLLGDIQNLYRSFDGKLIDPAICYFCKCQFSCLDSETGYCEDCFTNNQEMQEVYEWWVTSDWLVEKLKAKGQPILENAYGTWWGRCCSGQSIVLDYVIQDIYEETISL